MLEDAEALRKTVHKSTARSHKSALGQFMTNARVAQFMAGLFRSSPDREMRILDPGAGLGALSCAVLERFPEKIRNSTVEAWELDDRLASHLEETLGKYAALGASIRVERGDFLEGSEPTPKFTHCCMNPPYKKINAGSSARAYARRFGVETVNLYSAFVAAALTQMKTGGQVVAIIPRSFANGAYYKPFREFVLAHAAIHHIHIFESRKKAFSDDDVLQENVIVLLERGGSQGDVTVSKSSDDAFDDLEEKQFLFREIVKERDPESFIHMPSDSVDPLEKLGFSSTLSELGISVSTGPVVDFRHRDDLRAMPEYGTAPLLYAHHFRGKEMHWPDPDAKKPNAISVNDETRRWLLPAGSYLVLRRFSSKEEKRRVVASMLDASKLSGTELVGIENHLNFFHAGKKPIPSDLAWGLFVYLNCTQLDEHLRRFSGHTQVNATDLRNIRYPSCETLQLWGRWARGIESLDQSLMDAKVGESSQ